MEAAQGFSSEMHDSSEAVGDIGLGGDSDEILTPEQIIARIENMKGEIIIVTLEHADKDTKYGFSLLQGVNGTYLTGVVDNSTAEAAGCQAGDYLYKINDKVVASYNFLAVLSIMGRNNGPIKIEFKRPSDEQDKPDINKPADLSIEANETGDSKTDAVIE